MGQSHHGLMPLCLRAVCVVRSLPVRAAGVSSNGTWKQACQPMPTLFVSCKNQPVGLTHWQRFSVSVPKKQPTVYWPPLQLKLSYMLHQIHAAPKMSEVSWTSHWVMFATRARSELS